jgi:hypothetical protein
MSFLSSGPSDFATLLAEVWLILIALECHGDGYESVDFSYIIG